MSLDTEVSLYLKESTRVVLILPEPELTGLKDLEACDFVFALAFRCLEHEAAESFSTVARQQVAFLLGRLQGIAAKTEEVRASRRE